MTRWFQFSVRDWLWFSVLIAVVLGWWLHYRELLLQIRVQAARLDEQKVRFTEEEARYVSVARRYDNQTAMIAQRNAIIAEQRNAIETLQYEIGKLKKTTAVTK